jgi:hypothetical protein
MDNPKPNHLTQPSKEEENTLMEDPKSGLNCLPVLGATYSQCILVGKEKNGQDLGHLSDCSICDFWRQSEESSENLHSDDEDARRAAGQSIDVQQHLTPTLGVKRFRNVCKTCTKVHKTVSINS